MMNLESYCENPFKKFRVGRDKIVEFFEDYYIRLVQASVNGLPFPDFPVPFRKALTDLTNSKTATVVNLAEHKADTRILNTCKKEFKNAIKDFVHVLVPVYHEDTAEYLEFFPQGLKTYRRMTKGNINNLFAIVISACDAHKATLGVTPLENFQQIQVNYSTALANQSKKKEDTGNTRSAWDVNLEIVGDLAFDHLLSYAKEYKNQPGKIALLFDQSIITPPKRRKKPKGSKKILDVNIPVLTTVAASMSFSEGETIEIINNGKKSIFAYGAVTTNESAPESPTEIQSGKKVKIKAETLGAPTKKYLMLTNRDANDPGDVTIILW